MDRDWHRRMELTYENLSRAEKELVDYINTRPQDAAALKQVDLASAAGVSKPVVISCFRRMGFDDYRSFRDSIEGFFSTQINSLRAAQDVRLKVESLAELVGEAAAVDIRSLERLAESLDSECLEEVVSHLSRAESVYLIGEGTGGYPAHYLAARLRRYGLKAWNIGQDSRHIPDGLQPLAAGDAVLVFHYSDRDEWLSPVLNLAEERGAWSMVVSGTIHPDFVGGASRFVHVPRGELGFKNSMAVPMHFANLLLLAYETINLEQAENSLVSFEETRRAWYQVTGEKK